MAKLTLNDLKIKTLNKWVFYNIITAYITHHVKNEIKRTNMENRLRRIF